MNEALTYILEAIDKAKGSNTAVYHVREVNPFIDYAVITSAGNSRQLGALAEYVKKASQEHGLGYRHIEGDETSKWLLVDSDAIVVHIFEENERDVYALDKLYVNCERIL